MKAILFILFAALLTSCGGFSTRKCHKVAVHDIELHGHEIAWSLKDGFESYFITKDSLVLEVNSQSLKFPYYNSIDTLFDFRTVKLNLIIKIE